jgi:pimeloyl-ACP methyl ester carboxylesterase
MPAAAVAMQIQQVVATNDVSALAAVLKSGCNRSRVSLSDLRASQLPFLALIGELDGAASTSQAMNRDMPNQLELVILPGANHLTAPRHPDFATQLVRFLRARL